MNSIVKKQGTYWTRLEGILKTVIYRETNTPDTQHL